MKKILVIMAMEAEAMPIINKLGLVEQAPDEKLQSPFPRFKKKLDGKEIMISLNGKSKEHGVDRIGTEYAALNTQSAILEFRPDLIINAGTCGAFSKDAEIADIFTTKEPVVYHDHRVPLDKFEDFSNGNYPVHFNEAFFKGIDYKFGVISTGCSLDMPEVDEKRIKALGGMAKEMECASVASTAFMYGIPFIPIKSVTDLIDIEDCNVEQFLENLNKASTKLANVLIEVLFNIK